MKGLGAAARVFQLLDSQSVSVCPGVGRVLDLATPMRPVAFRDVHFEYPARSDAKILKGVNLDIQPGTSLAIAGGSGSGKSTIANLFACCFMCCARSLTRRKLRRLLRFYDPTRGEICFGEDNIRDYTPESWRQKIAVVPQDPALFSTTIAENSSHVSSSSCHSICSQRESFDGTT